MKFLMAVMAFMQSFGQDPHAGAEVGVTPSRPQSEEQTVAASSEDIVILQQSVDALAGEVRAVGELESVESP